MIKTFKQIIREHIDYKKQILKLSKMELKKDYKGSALGWLWAIIKPATTIFVYWFSFTIGLRIRADVNGYPFFLWLIAGIIPWFYMKEMLTDGARALRKNSYLVTKTRFPISTIPTIISISKFAVHTVLVVIMVIIFTLFGYFPDLYVLQVVFYMIALFVFFTIWGVFSSLITVVNKDFIHFIKSITTGIFWLSGILWNIDTINIIWLRRFLMLNPVTFITNGFRNCFINKIWFWEQPKRLMYFVIITMLLLLVTILVYKKLRKEITDLL